MKIDEARVVNYHGWKLYQDYDVGYAPYFLNTLVHRINSKLATNVVITGEAGIGKSYLAIDICRILEGIKKSGHERFSLSQVVFTYKEFLNAILKLRQGKVIVFDEPSYAMGKREWYKELNKALVATIESFRFKIHPLFIPIINKSLLDKTVRDHLIQYQILVKARGKAQIYRVLPGQFEDRTFHQYLGNLDFAMLDSDKCQRDSCLDCKNIDNCNLFRARYEKKKASIQESRYEQAKDMAERKETTELTMKQIENLAMALREKFIIEDKIDVQRLRVVLMDEYGLKIGNNKAYQLKAMIEVHHPNLIS